MNGKLFFCVSIFMFGIGSFTSIDGQATLSKKVDQYLENYLAMDAWSGVVGIYQEGVPVFQKAYGMADREWQVENSLDTKFRIASISKLFTEVAILQLTEAGKVNLDDTLSLFLPDYPRGDEITIRHLLTHRSGIPHLNSFPNYNELIQKDFELQEIIDLFKDLPLAFHPGEKYQYSNSGYVLLAFVMEQVSGQSYGDYLQTAIFDPIGLSNTGVDDEQRILPKRAKGYMFDNKAQLSKATPIDMSIKIGGGSLYSTLSDLNHFIQSLLRKKVLEETLTELPNFRANGDQTFFTVNGRVQGFCHQITHRVEEGLTIIVLGNHYSNIALPIADDLYRIYAGQDYVMPENYLQQEVALPADQLLAYEGVYDFGFGPIGRVEVVDGYLAYGTPGREDFDRLIPLGNHLFFYIQSWVLLEFKDAKAGEYQTLDWIMGGNRYPAQRIEN